MTAVEKETKDQLDEQKLAMKVSSVSIAINLLLSAFKLLAGLIAHSGAMISDGIHSASDVLSTFIVIIGVRISNRNSDTDHQYGHERMECVASIVLAVILALTGLGIGREGIINIMDRNYESLVVPGLFALVMAMISIVVKEWMFWYTRSAARKINSGALMADAWHHRSDALSSIGAFAGILGARMGYPILDSVASLVICGFIIKAAYEIFQDAVDKMVDKSCDNETIEKMKKTIAAISGVDHIDLIRTRLFGSRIYTDIEITCDGSMPLAEAHNIAECVHQTIEKEFPLVKHCMVHVNPSNEKCHNI